ncbi:MAG: hypothetical protein IIA92_03975 [Chloroflexi bacterium]|nr:hypothetical protein [Chloroflexota bacterium]
MNLTTIYAEYARLSPSYHQLKDEIVFSVEEALRKNGIAFHLVEGRVKSIDSLITKSEQNQIEEPFDEILDICGVRIIALFNSDLEACERVIEEIFEIKDIDKKTTKQPDSQFEYMSDHYIATLPTDFSGPRYDGIKGIQFEIQIRTIATHAWATISHYLDYKSQNAIPSNLRKDFYALNALFYLADSHFEQFFQASQKTRELTLEKSQSEGGIANEEINFDTVSTFLSQNYPDRVVSEPSFISELVDELVASEYRTISELSDDMRRAEVAFRYYEEELPPPSGKYHDVGVVRVSLEMVNPIFREKRRTSGEEYAKYQIFISPLDN